MQVDAEVDQRLQAELGGQPGGGQQHEQVVLGHQPRIAAQHDEGEDADDGEADQQAEFLAGDGEDRSEEHTSELQSLMRSSYAVFCLKKQKTQTSMNKGTS